MGNKINIAELLKDCPQGMELDCILFDNDVKVIFDGVDGINTCASIIKIVVIHDNNRTSHALTKYGQWNPYKYAKCVIFPKDKTTWNEFTPPFKFKDGDIIYVKSKSILNTELVGIYKKEDSELIYDYCSVSLNSKSFYHCNMCLINKNIIDISRLATEEEKQKLFQAIKDNGYKWNTKTKTLEKLAEPKFKVGDRVRNKNYKDYIYTIHDIVDKGYSAKEIDADYPIIILFGSQEDNYELVPNKFDITTLKPFDKVLMRSSNAREWTVTLYSHYNNNKFYGCGMCCDQCIPYEHNEHLRGTTNDCDDFYKTW